MPNGCRWVTRSNISLMGEVERFNARLVPKVFNQQDGLDYQENFSPVVKMVTTGVVIALLAMNLWPLFQIDVYNVFLYDDYKKEVYMQFPLEFGS